MWPGHEDWVTRDYGGQGKALSMSKEVLGNFVYHLLRCGGRIESSYAMAPEHARSYVQFSITLPKGRKEELERLTGVALERPSHLTPA